MLHWVNHCKAMKFGIVDEELYKKSKGSRWHS